MTRITTTILIFMVLMSGTIGIMDSSGLSDDLGVQLAPGASDSVDAALSHAENGFSANAGVVDTLVGLFAAGAFFIQALVKYIFAAPTMFINLGFPSWVVLPFTAPLYIISALELLYVLTGREML